MVPANQFVANVLFPVPFIDRTKLGINITPVTDSGTDYTVNYGYVSTNQFQIGRTPDTIANTYYWIAIGRWK